MVRRFKCPYCSKMYTREDLVKHIQDKHEDVIPQGYTATRVVFNSINYNTIDYSGKCVICGGPTKWDENKARYDRICEKKSCKETFVKTFESNMTKKIGVSRISRSIEGQERMLTNRKISGRYRFRDGGIRTFTGSYEEETLKFLDQVMECKSDDVMTPGPIMQYEYNGEPHWYISDIYYVPYNLVIEVKDGGDKPNTRNMPDYRARQIAKEKHIVNNTDYNYLRLTNKDFSQLLATMSDLKMQLVDQSYDRVVNINENMFAAIQGMMPMKPSSDSVYVVNYLKNNSFTGEPDIAVSDNPKFDSVFYRDEDGKLREGTNSILENSTYDIYMTETDIRSLSKALKENLNEFVEKGFLYESIFGNKMYTSDQIKCESKAIPTINEFGLNKALEEATIKYILDKPDSLSNLKYIQDPKFVVEDGNIYVRDNKPRRFIDYVLEEARLWI